MPSHTDAFFEELGTRGHEPGLRRRTATIRFEVSAGERVDAWSVMIDKGDIAVSSPGDRDTADCVIRTDRELFERISSGDANAMAALLRGALLADGDPELLIATRRLLPAAAGAEAVGKEDRS